jgi:hypothetical protein
MLSLMSSGDFASELQQSVRDHVAFIHTAAQAAKARIGQGIAAAQPAGGQPTPLEPADFQGPRPTVNFDLDEPDYHPAKEGAEPLFPEDGAGEGPGVEADPLFAQQAGVPDGAITFDDGFAVENVDDEGIPVWEDPP